MGRMEHDGLRLKRLRKITSLQVETLFFEREKNLIGKLIRLRGLVCDCDFGCFVALLLFWFWLVIYLIRI